jgi:PAS domain-containing protein
MLQFPRVYGGARKGTGVLRAGTKVSNVTQSKANQKPLELILARNLMSSLSTPAFLVDEGGVLVFYNEAAGILLGKRFEELGTVPQREWGALFGPFDGNGTPIAYDELPLVSAVRDGRPAHAEFTVRSADGAEHLVEASAFPILTAHGSRGALAMLWPSDGSGGSGGRDNGAGPA